MLGIQSQKQGVPVRFPINEQFEFVQCLINDFLLGSLTKWVHANYYRNLNDSVEDLQRKGNQNILPCDFL